MRIQYCSDLHLEFEKNSRYLTDKPLVVKGEILILAGDIIPLHDEYFNNPFFSFVSDNYKQVFWVPGNHEFYYKDISQFSKSYNIKLKSNINIVHNVDVIYENVRLIFSTLWSKISTANEKNIEQQVSDFDCILKNNKKLKVPDFNFLHNESIDFINRALSNITCKTIVVTHHLPTCLCNTSAGMSSPINEAFCVDLTDYIQKSGVNFWIYGHNHFNKTPIYIGNTIMLTNQLGYVHCNEHKSFRHNAYIAV